MNPIAFQRNVGAYVKSVFAIVNTAVVAGGGADGVAQNGVTVDRFVDMAPSNLNLSAVLVVGAEVNVSGADTATIRVRFEDSPLGSVWTAYPAFQDGVTEHADVVISVDGNTAYKYPVELGRADQFVRAVITVTMSAGATDTCNIGALFVAGGGAVTPIA